MNKIYTLNDLTNTQISELETKYNTKLIQVGSSVYTFKGSSSKSYTMFLGSHRFSGDESETFFQHLSKHINSLYEVNDNHKNTITLFNRVEVAPSKNGVDILVYMKMLSNEESMYGNGIIFDIAVSALRNKIIRPVFDDIRAVLATEYYPDDRIVRDNFISESVALKNIEILYTEPNFSMKWSPIRIRTNGEIFAKGVLIYSNTHQIPIAYYPIDSIIDYETIIKTKDIDGWNLRITY